MSDLTDYQKESGDGTPPPAPPHHRICPRCGQRTIPSDIIAIRGEEENCILVIRCYNCKTTFEDLQKKGRAK